MEDNIQVLENQMFNSVLVGVKKTESPLRGLSSFDFEGHAIRCVDENGKIWFVAMDVGEALGLTQVRKNLSVLRDCEKGRKIIPTLGGSQEMWVVSESGLNTLVLRCNDALKAGTTAFRFRVWVTDEVLPSIRKHGAYMTPETLEAAVLNPDSLLKIALRLKEETDKRKALEAKVEEDRPKLDYYNEILHCENAILVTAIAKDYGMSAVAFNKKLNELGIQYKRGGTWFLYDRYADQGYTRSETYKYTNGEGCDCANISTRWTQKGRLFLYEQLKAVGIVPVVEAA